MTGSSTIGCRASRRPITTRSVIPPDGTEATGVRHAVHHPFLKIPAALAPYPSHAHIDLLSEARGQGVGRHLMQTMMERLTELGSPGLHLQVSPKNKGAQDFYRGLGFEMLCAPDLPDDTLFMARRLGELDGED
jgi:ribosomal protein S18 acetylase RimI-like enzyme